MEMYWVLLLAPSLFSVVSLRRAAETKLVFAILFLLFAVAVGLRDDVGMDWANYTAIYDSMLLSGFNLEDITREPIFYGINLLALETGLGITFVNLVHALVFLSGLFYFAYRKCPDKFLALAVATPYLVIVIGMSGIRQAAAIGIFLYLLAEWHKFGNVRKLLILVLAAGFHTTAILLSALLLIDREKNAVQLFLAGVAVLAAGLFVIGPNQDYYVSSYVQENLQSEGALYHALLVVLPAVAYVMLRKRFQRAGLYEPFLFRLALLTIAVFPFLLVSSTGVDRFLLYFTGVQLYVFSALPRVLNAKSLRPLLVLMNVVILWVWLEFANNAIAWRVYNSCLTSSAGCFN